MRRLLCSVICALGLLAFANGSMAAPKVVTSILPVHSLVAGVMKGVGEPTLLVRGSASPHNYALRPSEARALERADVIFWIGEDLETFLTKPLASLGKKARIVTLSTAAGVNLLEVREGGAWETHEHGEGHDDAHGKENKRDHDDHDKHDDHGDRDGHAKSKGHDGHDHGRGETDLHLWLDPGNAEAIVLQAVAVLSEADRANVDTYRANGVAVLRRLELLEQKIRRDVRPVRNRPFIVFHDAYQYYEKHFGLNGRGSATINPERSPGAKRIGELRATLKTLNVACIFAEPQFRPTVIETISQGTDAKISMLDPIGASLKPGPDAYFQLMENLTFSLRACLSPPA